MEEPQEAQLVVAIQMPAVSARAQATTYLSQPSAQAWAVADVLPTRMVTVIWYVLVLPRSDWMLLTLHSWTNNPRRRPPECSRNTDHNTNLLLAEICIGRSANEVWSLMEASELTVMFGDAISQGVVVLRLVKLAKRCFGRAVRPERP